MSQVLTTQQEAELAFWSHLVQGVGLEYYIAYRAAEYRAKTRHFPHFLNQRGTGIDYGCGCVSVFELSSKEVWAVEPLWNFYMDLLTTDDFSYETMLKVKPCTPSPVDWV